MVYILIYIGVIVVVIIGATLWGKFDPKVKAANAEYEKSLEGKSSNKKTIHRSLDNTEVRTIMKKTEKTYHENGSIHVESELNEKGERHGITRIYHENGQLQVEVNWTNGIQDDGIINSYHDNGIKARQVIHLNGDFNGEFSEWHENGQLKRKSFYEANMIHGIYKTWDSFGNLKNNFFKHKFIDTIDCEKFVSYNREQKNIEEIEVNWLQDIGPIYKKFIDKNEVTPTLQHTLDDENEYISVFSHNEEDAKNIIDTVIENNGGFSVFESFESENWHYNNSGCLFNIGYKIIIPDKLYVVQLNRDTKNEELEDSKFKEYGVANLQEIIKNEWSEELDHIRLGITKRVDHFESNEESNQGVEYTSIEYSLKIKLYYEGDDEYEDDYETPGLVIVDVMLNDSNGAILSSSEREGLVFCDPKSEESYFFDEFEELFNSDVKYFGDHLIAEFNNAINDFGKAWGNPSDDQNDKIELEKLFDFKKILIRLQEYQAKKKL